MGWSRWTVVSHRRSTCAGSWETRSTDRRPCSAAMDCSTLSLLRSSSALVGSSSSSPAYSRASARARQSRWRW